MQEQEPNKCIHIYISRGTSRGQGTNANAVTIAIHRGGLVLYSISPPFCVVNVCVQVRIPQCYRVSSSVNIGTFSTQQIRVPPYCLGSSSSSRLEPAREWRVVVLAQGPWRGWVVEG
eukprot:scaffold121408_cov30-Tisochrysis_lutea.AAC.1